MFERGFKAWCENVSLELRRDLGLSKESPLRPIVLADYLEVPVWTPSDLTGIPAGSLKALLVDESDDWSALTISIGDSVAIVHNTSHSKRRQSSDLMHELAHIVVGHEASKVEISKELGMAMRSFDRQQEEEANWMSGCLLLPRAALVAIGNSRHKESACGDFGVSMDLLTYRLNVTGVTAQMEHRRRRRRRE